MIIFSLCILPSCTIFSGSSEEEQIGEEEDYYPTEEGVEDPIDSAPESEEGIETADNEDIEYIDEEDQDLLEEGAVPLDDTADYVDNSLSNDESALPEDQGDSSSDFFDPSLPAKPSPVATRVTPPPAKKWISYKKIKSQPYNSAGFLINAVYIAREGDSMESVSQKVFGSDQTQQLNAINPHLKVRSLKTGDKIYYPSPNRPQDSQQLLFYFEDKGIPPQYHQVRAEENIRQIASSLLGHKDSWKEIWATNPELESKGTLNQNMTIKYWPAGADSLPTEPAEVTPEEPEAGEEALSGSPDVGGDPESPPLDEGDDFSAEEEAGLTPQPPPSEDAGTDLNSHNNEEDGATVSSPSSGLSQIDMAIAGILALGALILAGFLIKRKWKGKTDFDYTAVNYEINK